MSSLENIRLRQAKRLHRLLWILRFGSSFPLEQYLLTVPPLLPATDDPEFFNLPVLVDTGPCLERACIQYGIRVKSKNLAYVDRKESTGLSSYWIWCHNGTRYTNVSPRECVSMFRPGECGMTAKEGVAFHAQYPAITRSGFIDLPGSVLERDPSRVACIGPWHGNRHGRVWLHHVHEDQRHRKCATRSHIISLSRAGIE